jgi:hypothetical protein
MPQDFLDKVKVGAPHRRLGTWLRSRGVEAGREGAEDGGRRAAVQGAQRGALGVLQRTALEAFDAFRICNANISIRIIVSGGICFELCD